MNQEATQKPWRVLRATSGKRQWRRRWRPYKKTTRGSWSSYLRVGEPSGRNRVFKRQEDATGNVVHFKARLVAQGFCQKYGSEYDPIFAPVVRQTTFRTVLTLASSRKMLTRHVDIKTAYLYGELQEEIFMRQPPGYTNEDPSVVCHLNQSLYGLKQAARVWNRKIDAVLKEAGSLSLFEAGKRSLCVRAVVRR